MTNQPALVALRDALAFLYTDASSARRVAGDAGLDLRQISFSSRALDNWTAILEEAEKQGLVPRLIDIGRREYPTFPPLTDAAATYFMPLAMPAIAQPSRPTQNPASQPTVRHLLTIDTIRQLTDALVPGGLTTSDARDALLQNIHPGFVASLPNRSSPLDQVRSDLEVMNQVPVLADGQVPLQIWLDNAVSRLRQSGRVEVSLFQMASDELGRETQ